jgi:hypothetical protein
MVFFRPGRKKPARAKPPELRKLRGRRLIRRVSRQKVAKGPEFVKARRESFARRKRVGFNFVSPSGNKLMVFAGGNKFLEEISGRQAVKALMKGSSPAIIDGLEEKLRGFKKWLLHPDSPFTTFEVAYAPGKSVIVKDFTRVTNPGGQDFGFREALATQRAMVNFDWAVRKGLITPKRYCLKGQEYLLATPNMVVIKPVFRPVVWDIRQTVKAGMVPDYLYDFSGSDFHARALTAFFGEFERQFQGKTQQAKRENLMKSLEKALADLKRDNGYLEPIIYPEKGLKMGISIAEPNIMVEEYNPKTGVWTFRLLDRE